MIPGRTDEAAGWRRWRSRFWIGLLLALMVLIAVAGALNVWRILHAPA